MHPSSYSAVYRSPKGHHGFVGGSRGAWAAAGIDQGACHAVSGLPQGSLMRV